MGSDAGLLKLEIYCGYWFQCCLRLLQFSIIMVSPDQPQHNVSFSDKSAQLLGPRHEFTSLFKRDSINEHSEMCV